MKSKLQRIGSEINPLISELRGQKIIMAAELASIYGVTTKALNQAVKRNAQKFPRDFVFKLTAKEALALQSSRSQIVTLKQGQNIKHLPYAFTEHGALMAANCLKSPRAVEMSVYVVRAFIKIREELVRHLDFAKRLGEIEKTLLSHDTSLRNLYNKIRPLLMVPEPPRREIGFHAKPDISQQIKNRK